MCLPLLFLAQTLSANSYEIQSIVGTTITLSNNAAFKMAYGFMTPITWEAGQFVEFASFQDPNQFPIHVESINGQFVVSPLFLLRNESETIAYYQPSEIVPDPNTPAIISIDLPNRILTLSDSTQWAYPEEEGYFVKSWEINDLLMIGKGDASFSILFDTDKRQAVRAVKQ